MNGILDAQTSHQALAIALAVGFDRLWEIEGGKTDARILLAFAAGLQRDQLHRLEVVDFTEPLMLRYLSLLERRQRREPIAQIIGTRLFWGHSFIVTRDTLDPRPETETLIIEALKSPARSILDLGTGTGAILLSLLAEWPKAQGTGTDISAAALAVAQANTQALGLASRTTLVASDWFASLTDQYDLITSNPPYIAADEMPHLAPEVHDWEPHIALTPGGDGLDAYRAIAAGAAAHLNPHGRILVEIGPTQGAAVCALFAAAGFQHSTIQKDMDGRDRIVAARHT